MSTRSSALLVIAGGVVLALLILAGALHPGDSSAEPISAADDAKVAANGAPRDEAAAHAEAVSDSASAAKPAADGKQPFSPPRISAMPKGKFGDMVKLGHDIFTHTQKFAGQYVGNTLSCSNCHLDAGRLANSAPLWAAWVSYPAYRSKNGHVNTFAERLQGCFRFSMNGKAPPLGGDTLLALESYSYWMAKGLPTGTKIKGRGYPKLPKPAQVPDYARGKIVYAQHCALCHQPDGRGLKVAGQAQFPALWGPDSFNWGAGMHSLKNASAFIKANMPLGLGNSLSDQQAWDVAMYMDSHERPQDPRYTGSVAATRKKFHDSPMSMYGQTVNGHLLGQGSTPSGGSVGSQR